MLHHVSIAYMHVYSFQLNSMFSCFRFVFSGYTLLSAIYLTYRPSFVFLGLELQQKQADDDSNRTDEPNHPSSDFPSRSQTRAEAPRSVVQNRSLAHPHTTIRTRGQPFFLPHTKHHTSSHKFINVNLPDIESHRIALYVHEIRVFVCRRGHHHNIHTHTRKIFTFRAHFQKILIKHTHETGIQLVVFSRGIRAKVDFANLAV